jgi:hypothetical protein
MQPLRDLQSEFAAGLRDPAAAVPGSLRPQTGKLPKRRFNVYRNNVAVSLIEALKSTFPAVAQLVGEDFFRATARAYIDQEPPRSPLLFLYGASFGDFLDSFPPAASVPYLGDIARLEWARLSAYHAADRDALRIESLAALPPELLGALTFELHPSLVLISSRWPLFSIWAASTARDSEDKVRMTQPEDLVVVRPDLDVDTRLLPPGGYSFMKALLEGVPLGEAAGRAMETSNEFDLAIHLQGLFQLGAVTAIHQKQE